MANEKGNSTVVVDDHVVQAAIAAALARVDAVPATPSLVQWVLDQGWNDWDEASANIVVSDPNEPDNLGCDDDELPQQAA